MLEGILVFNPSPPPPPTTTTPPPSLQPSILFEQYWRWKNLTQITKTCIERIQSRLLVYLPMQLVGSWIPTSHKPPTVTSGRTKQPQLYNTGRNTSHQFASKTGWLTVLDTMHAVMYHWRELPQVSFVATKAGLPRQNFCTLSRQNIFVATNMYVLSQQAYFCYDKRRVCRDKSKLVATKPLSRQT